MSSLVYYVVDLETTGLSPKLNHEIVELSCIRAHDRVQFSRTVRADYPKFASLDALRITGKSMADLKRGISKLEMMDEFDAFLARDGLTPAHRCIVGHNIGFDRKFLHHQWKKFERDFQADLWLDTIPFCRRVLSKLGHPKSKVNLESAMDTFGLKKVAGLHTAKGDTRNTYYLFDHLVKTGIDFIDLLKQEPMRKMEAPSIEDLGAEDFVDDNDSEEEYFD